jgi:hypothetical protein
MFNFIKRAVNAKETIEKIHNDFDTAGEKLLAEAKEILSDAKSADKGERLKKLGFGSSVSSVKAADYAAKKELAALIEYYNVYYPNNKFITEKMVVEICKKYGLICGSSHSYKGDVPLKNLNEMESFKLREEDMRRIDYSTYSHDPATGRIFYDPNGKYYGAYCVGVWGHHFETKPKEETHHFEKGSFKICAPSNDFEMSNSVLKGVFLIPDPIVLQPIKGGYLIVTKWGLEANDEIALNEKHN